MAGTGAPITITWLLNSARMIAAGRVAVALSLVILSITDPGYLGIQSEADDIIALGFLAVSLVILFVAWRDWWLDHTWQRAVLVLDLMVFISLPSLVEPAITGYRIAALTTATFILLAVSVRWDWRTAGRIAILLNVLNIALTSVHPLSGLLAAIRNSDPHELHEYVRNLYFFALVSMLIVWVGSRISSPRAPGFRPAFSGGADYLLDEGLAYAADGVGAMRGAVCWRRHDGATCRLSSLGVANGGERAISACRVVLTSANPPRLFDAVRGRALERVADGTLTASRDVPAPLPGLEDAEVGFDIPLRGASGSGRLMVCGMRAPSTDMLAYLVSAGAEVAAAIDRQQASQLASEQALAQIRQTLARDLHDSLAQTLAGVRFWLRSLRGRDLPPAALAVELDRFDALLAEETQGLRSVLDAMRDGAGPGSEGEGFERLFATLAATWGISVRAAAPLAALSDLPTLAFEVRQIVREAVSNAVRHGGAGMVEISLTREPDHVVLEIQDDGRGFDAQRARPRMIAQRVADLGGVLAISFASSRTILQMRLPLD